MKERRYNLSVRRFLAWVIAIAVAVSILTVPQTESYAAGGKIKTIAVTNLPAKQLTLKKGKSFTLKTKVTATGKISKKVAYKSSNKKVATVNAKGKITAKKKDQYISLHSSDYYCLHKDKNITRIPFNDIISISRLGHDCCITTASGLYTERTSLKNMEQHLPEPFIRCHKSCIVNINHVTSLSGSTIYLANKQTQTVGRNYLDDVRKALLRIAQ